MPKISKSAKTWPKTRINMITKDFYLFILNYMHRVNVYSAEVYIILKRMCIKMFGWHICYYSESKKDIIRKNTKKISRREKFY